MSRLAKLLNSALHNSNPNEASQALKLAAGEMQSKGLNPSDYISLSHDDDTEIVDSLMYRINMLEQDLKDSRKANEDLKRTSSSHELREAKQIAIKWHKKASSLEEEISEYAKIAVKSSTELKSLQEKFQQKNFHFLVATLVASLEAVLIWLILK